ncbi:hypothetical protein GCM10023238_31800 [Streptomyces heliomycini]
MRVDGSGPTHLSLFAGHVLTANYGSGSVSAVPVRPDGGLAPVSGVFRHSGSGPHPQRQRGPHAHQVQPDPSGRWRSVSTSARTRYGSAPWPTACSHRTARPPCARGSGPRHLAFHPDGSYAYVLNELSPTLVVCRWDAAGGALRPLAELPVLPGAPAGDAYPSGVAVSPDGRFVWTATRGEDVLSVFAVEGRGETLTPVATVPCGGHWPRAITESDGVLYVANERSGDVTWFALDPDTGVPRRAGSVPVAAASCVVTGRKPEGA